MTSSEAPASSHTLAGASHLAAFGHQCVLPSRGRCSSRDGMAPPKKREAEHRKSLEEFLDLQIRDIMRHETWGIMGNLDYLQFAIEHGHGKSGCTHWKLWFSSICFYPYQKVSWIYQKCKPCNKKQGFSQLLGDHRICPVPEPPSGALRLPLGKALPVASLVGTLGSLAATTCSNRGGCWGGCWAYLFDKEINWGKKLWNWTLGA